MAEPEEVDRAANELAARTRARLVEAAAKVVRLKAELAQEEALLRELQFLVEPGRAGGGGRSTKAEIARRIEVLCKILRDRGPLLPGALHTEAARTEGEDFTKQALIDLLRRKTQYFVSHGNGTWGLVQGAGKEEAAQF